MRIAMNMLMIAKWRALGPFQARYVPAMIGPFLEVSLIPHTGVYMCIHVTHTGTYTHVHVYTAESFEHV